MDKELQQYYEARIEMFNSKGWKDLIEDAIIIKQKTEDIHAISTIEQLHHNKGELSILEWFITIEQVSRLVYDQLLLEDK